MGKQILLVIDVQDATLAPLIGKKQFLANINRLIDFFHANKLPVIFITQAGAGKLSKKLNRFKQDYTAAKTLSNAFTSTEFTNILTHLQANSLVITGLMSQACVQKTAKGALENDYQVTLISDAHDSILKPLRMVYNKRLSKLGIRTLSTDNYLNH